MDIKEINKQLQQGQLPDCFNFVKPQPETIDWEKVAYNAFYKSYDFHASKLPTGYEQIPGFDQVIQAMADNSLLPSNALEVIKEEKAIVYTDE